MPKTIISWAQLRLHQPLPTPQASGRTRSTAPTGGLRGLQPLKTPAKVPSTPAAGIPAPIHHSVKVGRMRRASLDFLAHAYGASLINTVLWAGLGTQGCLAKSYTTCSSRIMPATVSRTNRRSQANLERFRRKNCYSCANAKGSRHREPFMIKNCGAEEGT